MKRALLSLACLLLTGLSVPSGATVIDFTGGTVTLKDGTTQTTNNSVVWQDVDYYEEDGFRLDFIPNTSNTPFESIIGDYYGAGNDVIHGHWATGDFGGLTQIKVTKLDGQAFDVNYFVLASNTDTGGGSASGNEQTRIYASTDGTTISYSKLLPPEDWGFPATQIFLGSEFDSVKAFWFAPDNAVDCFGMDNFYINEPAPAPEPATLGLLGLGLAGLGFSRRRKA